MAKPDFFALGSDIELVIEFVFEQTDCRVFEAYSRPGHKLREFSDLKSLIGSDCLETNHGRYFLRFFSRTIDCEPIIRDFILTKTGQTRQDIGGPGVFQVIEGHRMDAECNALSWSSFGHWRDAGAKQRSNDADKQLEAVDWKRMRSVSGRIQRHIKNQLAVAKIRSRPISPGAFAGFNDSLTRWAGPGVVD